MNFEEAFHELLGHEGGYSDHPNDPGGKTMWGVTEKVARARGYRGDMRDLTVEFAKSLYKELYWDAVKAESVPAPVRYALFDAAVNSGVEQAAKWLQRSVGVTEDGKIGPKTLEAVSKADAEALEARFLGYRLLAMTDMKNWQSFSRGWGKRIAKLLIEW